MSASTPTLRDRLGGRWALSWQASVSGSALIVVLFASQGAGLSHQGDVYRSTLTWVGVALIAIAAKSLWQLLGNATVLRHRRGRPLPVWGVVLFDLGTGLVFGVTALLAEAALAASPTELTLRSAAIRAVAFAVSALWWYLITTLAFDSADRFVHERRALLEELVEWQGMLLREEQVEGELRATVRGELDESVQRARSGVLAARYQSGDDMSAVSDDLRMLAGTSVRSLSHDLMRRADQMYPRTNLRSAPRVMLREQRFAVLPMALLSFLILLPSGLTGRMSGSGLVGVVVAAALIALVLAVSNGAMERRPSASRWITLAAFVILQGVALACQVVVSDTPSAMRIVGTFLALTLGVVVTSVLRALHTHRARVLERLRVDSDEARAAQTVLSTRLATATRKVASELHGSLQTRLLACAGALDHASRAGDPGAVDAALSRVLEILADPLADAGPNGTGAEGLDLAEAIGFRVCEWDGLLSVRVDVDPSLSPDFDGAADAAAIVVEEALANAYRHGQATDVEVVARRRGRELILTVRDNGVGLGSQPAGLGVRRMQSLGRATIESVPGGVLATVIISCEG